MHDYGIVLETMERTVYHAESGQSFKSLMAVTLYRRPHPVFSSAPFASWSACPQCSREEFPYRTQICGRSCDMRVSRVSDKQGLKMGNCFIKWLKTGTVILLTESPDEGLFCLCMLLDKQCVNQDVGGAPVIRKRGRTMY